MDGGKIGCMLAQIRSIGLFLGSVKGWVVGLSLMPTALTYLLSMYEQLPWAVIVMFTTVALGMGVWLAWGVLKLYESAMSHFTSLRERTRIKTQITEYIDAVATTIDLHTAAGLWAGTMAPDNVQRLLFFRIIKIAGDNETIRNATFANSDQRADIRTRIPLNEFADFLRTKGVLK